MITINKTNNRRLTFNPTPLLVGLFRWMQFSIPKWHSQAEIPVEQDLLRLAQTSPHLLSDLGLTRDPERQDAGMEVWVSDRAPYEVHLTSTKCEPHIPCARAQGFRS
ncbi:hypothetical protein TRM7615_01793 [Falsiruegeria mediterranea M17]|uniref:Uncharacterized protein n=1 Tax=Falsiruegeria mediterranea M17 TaxID=1200281 RepID=A0A2R8C7B3_9RHOB|nr:hypothetical protein TRM7615_01793 [Falsiruegeria mediterranea M17]